MLIQNAPPPLRKPCGAPLFHRRFRRYHIVVYSIVSLSDRRRERP
jgi:hypothetical protein